MEKIAETEQWLLNGDCTKCRRKSYCKKACTKSKRRLNAHMKMLIEGKMNELTDGVYGQIMSNLSNCDE